MLSRMPGTLFAAIDALQEQTETIVEVATLLGKFKSKEGDITVYEPSGLLIIRVRW